jgi:hypothetical protein
VDLVYYPSFGRWVAAYADNVADYDFKQDPMLGERIADVESYYVNPITLVDMGFWLHDAKLDCGWQKCGYMASQGESENLTAFPNVNPDSGQTWPLRIGDGNPVYFENDRATLMKFLSDSDVRNFYGYSHGDFARFFSFWAYDYGNRVHHRYRFVFFDGCNTAAFTAPLYKAFGATDFEMMFPAYPPMDVNPYGVVPNPGYYERNRPAAYLGWKTESQSKRRLTSPVVDPITGYMCYWVTYEAMCNWHVMFLFYWAIQGQELLDAIESANADAMGPISDPPVDSSLCVDVIFADGRMDSYVFNPGLCLRVFGDGRLRFNGQNSCGQWIGDVCNDY